MNKVAVVVETTVQYYAVKPLCDLMAANDIGFDYILPDVNVSNHSWKRLFGSIVDFFESRGIPYKTKDWRNEQKYEISFSSYMASDVASSYKIRYRYGLTAKPEVALGLGTNSHYDCFLCYGEAETRHMTAYGRTVVIGEPRMYGFKRDEKPAGEKPVLLYAPTYGDYSAVKAACTELASLKDRYRIIAKAHHGTDFLPAEADKLSLLSDCFDEIYHSDLSIFDLFKQADVVLSDNSGALFAAMAAGVPAARFATSDAKDYCGFVPYQTRLANDGVLPSTNDPLLIGSVLERAMEPEIIESQQRFVREQYCDPEEGAERFVEFIKEVLEGAVYDDAYFVYKGAKNEIEFLNSAIEAKDAQIAVKEKVVSQKDAEIAKLKEELEKAYGRIGAANAALNAVNAAKVYHIWHLYSRIRNQLLKGSAADRQAFWKWLLNRRRDPSLCTDEYHPLLAVRTALDDSRVYIGGIPVDSAYVAEVKENYLSQLEGAVPGGLLDWLVNHKVIFDNISAAGGNSKTIVELQSILDNPGKGIVVYPATVPWEPFQTPQQLLLAFAKCGYKCIFCEPALSTDGIKKLDDGVWAVSEDTFLMAVENREVAVMLTWMGSLPFARSIKNAKIWYHVLDKLDIFSLYDETYEAAHKWAVNNADYVSYVAAPLLSCMEERRHDAIYLPNACHAEELIDLEAREIPEDMREICGTGKPVIGYFGWVASWFDFEGIERAALERPDYQYVIIGPLEDAVPRVKEWTDRLKELPNVHFLGRKKYQDLVGYARRFTVATVPFLINEMMDCVSPIKFYEYCAHGLPTITSYMPEMVQFECEFVACYNSTEEFISLIDKFVTDEVTSAAAEKAVDIARQNTWVKRIETMQTHLFDKKEA